MSEVKQEPSAETEPTNENTGENSNGTNTGRDNKPSRWGAPRPTSIEPFKEAIPELSGKVFITGPTQEARYDET